MARRIDIELTSKVDDETWTWRAAGARQPKGRLAGKLLPDGVKAGDVLRAEVQDDIDGVEVLSILPTKEKRAEPERLTILAPEERRSAPPPPARAREARRPARGAPDRERDADRDRRPQERAQGRERERDRTRRPPRQQRPAAEPSPPPRPKPKRLSPGHTHRHAVLNALPPEQKPIAEQLLRGGIPAVRQAIETQNAELTRGGRPAIKAEPLLALAEELLPPLKAAEWRDRADAAIAAGDDISLRDLRSVVTSAEVARDDETRLLARTLREALDSRLAHERESWLAEITGALSDGRVVRALRIASRPPDAAMRFPVELGGQLAEAAGAAMSADAAPDRWLAVLDAVSVSPVRRSVTPAGLPADPSSEFVETVKQASSRVPAVGPLVGVTPSLATPPPPPRPRPKPPAPPTAKQLPHRRPPGAAAPTPPEAAEAAPAQLVRTDQNPEPTEETVPAADT